MRAAARWARSPAVIGYLVLAVAVVYGFHTAGDDRTTARRGTCVALREDRVLLGRVIDASIPPQAARQPDIDPTLDPSVRRLIEESRVRSAGVRRDIGRLLAQPIELCRGTGVDPSVRLNAFERRTP